MGLLKYTVDILYYCNMTSGIFGGPKTVIIFLIVAMFSRFCSGHLPESSHTLNVHGAGDLRGGSQVSDAGWPRRIRAKRESNTLTGAGTTPNIRDIFLGRCYEYKCKYCEDESTRNCSELWRLFSDSFSYRDPCSSHPNDFADFVNKTSSPVPANKVLFWSGTNSLANAVADLSGDFHTLEQTLVGALLDRLTFCGQLVPPGINYTSCRLWNYTTCRNHSLSAFWDMTSSTFARQASGNVTVVLNGSRSDGAYRRSSFFGRVEIPNLDPEKVATLTAFVVHNLDGPVLDTCGNGSLLMLQEDLESKGIHVECIDDPSFTRNIQCVENPSHVLCPPAVLENQVTCGSNPGESPDRLTTTWSAAIILYIVQASLR